MQKRKKLLLAIAVAVLLVVGFLIREQIKLAGSVRVQGLPRLEYAFEECYGDRVMRVDFAVSKDGNPMIRVFDSSFGLLWTIFYTREDVICADARLSFNVPDAPLDRNHRDYIFNDQRIIFGRGAPNEAALSALPPEVTAEIWQADGWCAIRLAKIGARTDASDFGGMPETFLIQ